MPGFANARSVRQLRTVMELKRATRLLRTGKLRGAAPELSDITSFTRSDIDEAIEELVPALQPDGPPSPRTKRHGPAA